MTAICERIINTESSVWKPVESALRREIILVANYLQPLTIGERLNQFVYLQKSRLAAKVRKPIPIESIPGLIPESGIDNPLGYYTFQAKSIDFALIERGIVGNESFDQDRLKVVDDFLKIAPREWEDKANLEYCVSYADLSAKIIYLSTLGDFSSKFSQFSGGAEWRKAEEIIRENCNLSISLFHHAEIVLERKKGINSIRVLRAQACNVFAKWLESREDLYVQIGRDNLKRNLYW